MTSRFASIAFTDSVRDAQTRYGSRSAFARHDGDPVPEPDPLTDIEEAFIAARDGFYLSTVSETGWPYIQFRGGPRGFLRVLDEHTIGWADFRGNRQYISMGNAIANDRAALFLMDYANQLRLKVFGHLEIIDAADRPELAETLAVPGYRAKVERSVLVRVEAFNWNCHQHITPRYTLEELRQPRADSA